MKPGVSLVGFHGWGYRETGGSVLVLNDECAACMIDMTDAFGACVKGIQLSGNKLLGKNIHGIMMRRSEYNGGRFEDGYRDDNPLLEPTHSKFREDNFVICDCQCKNFSGDGIHLNHIFAFTVSDCQLMSNGGDGIYVNGWDGWIHDCIIHTNNGAGIGSNRPGSICASLTITGNRIEWNKGGGICTVSGDSLSINNNFFDRSGGAAVSLRGDSKNGIKDVTVTGNIFRRNGKQNFGEFDDKRNSSHIYAENIENTVISANVFKYGQDDGRTGMFTPDYCISLKNAENSVITSNSMHNGCMTDTAILTEECSGVLIKDNITD